MVEIIGGYFTSHVPAIGGAIHKGLQADAYWKPFFDAFLPVHPWINLPANQRLSLLYVTQAKHGERAVPRREAEQKTHPPDD